jgi:hypothetical protein
MKDDQSKGSDEVQGEGDYKSARRYKRDIDTFLKEKGDRIADQAKEAERAVDSPEGEDLARAEDKGKSKARH